MIALSQSHILSQFNKLSLDKFSFFLMIPMIFIILNALLVFALKVLQYSVIIYTISLPVLLFLSVGLSYALTEIIFYRNKKEYFESESRLGIKPNDLCLVLVPLLIGLVHVFIIGSSFSGDAFSYYTFPIQAFEERKSFNFDEQPFIEFGEQPLATYWLYANLEYVPTALAGLFGKDFVSVVSIMLVLSISLFSFAVLLFARVWLPLVPSILVTLAFFCLLYWLSVGTYSLGAMSIFRGYENKGIIWGYFLFSVVSVFCLPRNIKIPTGFYPGTGIVLGLSAILVSGNAIFLIFPIVTMAALSIIHDGRIGNFFFAFAALGSIVAIIIIIRLLEVTDVYDVVDANLTFREPPVFREQLARIALPMSLWICATLAVVVVGRTHLRLAIGLLVYLLISAALRTQLFYDFFYWGFPEYTLNFWRPIIMVHPAVAILIAMVVILSTLPDSKMVRQGFLGSLIMVSALTIGSMMIFPRSPFPEAKRNPGVDMLMSLCPDKSIVLADRYFGTILPVWMPQHQYLVGKEYFLNWQIANLASDSNARSRAEMVRDASLFLSLNPVTNQYGNDPKGLLATLAAEKPDLVVILRRAARTDVLDKFMLGYSRMEQANVTAYVGPRCQ